MSFFESAAKTPINITNLAQELEKHPDVQFTQYLLSGLTQGFHTGPAPPVVSIECKNLRSALSHSEHVSSLIDAEVEKGYLYGPFD